MEKKEIEENFEILKEFLLDLSKDVEKEYVKNKDYPRFKRCHEWQQKKKTLDILVKRLNHVEASILFMIEDAQNWKGIKGPKYKFL
jgi:hypothetical protein